MMHHTTTPTKEITVNSAIMIDTPAGISYARLAALKGAVRLESVGLRHSKIRSVRKMAALEMGLKASAKCPEVIAALQAKMDEMLANRSQ
jgi:hypothetical protein